MRMLNETDIDQNGNVVKRFSAKTEPETIVTELESLFK